MQDVPYGFCHCGCGERTRLAEQNSRQYGWVKGEPHRYIAGHYARTLKPTLPGEPEFAERFWKRVDKAGEGGCWVWTGRFDRKGYGVIAVGPSRYKRHRSTHRVAYELVVGPIGDGLTLDHLCENTACVNPDHLEPVMRGVNNLRGNSPWALNAKKTHCVCVTTR